MIVVVVVVADVVVLVVVVNVAVVLVVVVVVVMVVVDVCVTDVVVMVVIVDVVVMQVSHKLRHRSRTFTPTALVSLQEEAVYGLSCPHSFGSGTPLHKPVVVEVVAVVVVEVVVVMVVDAMHESHAIGQSGTRSGNVLHCADVTPLQSWAGSGVRVGSAPLQSSQSVPDQG